MIATAGRLGLASAATGCTAARVEECPCMGCRTNLKKEKRVRNRINAFRFKKGGFVRRRFGPDYAAEQAKERDGAALQTSPSEPIVSFAICRCDVNRGGTFHKSSNTLGQRISFEWLDPPEPPLNVSRAGLS